MENRTEDSMENEQTQKRKNYCRRCGYIWNARVVSPEHCPKCKSRIWDCDHAIWSCGACGCVKGYRTDMSAGQVCPGCGSSLWKEVSVLFVCGCGFTARRLRDTEPQCPMCGNAMSVSAPVSVENKRKRRCDRNPLYSEVRERAGAGQGPVAIAMDLGISFQTVMDIIDDRQFC